MSVDPDKEEFARLVDKYAPVLMFMSWAMNQPEGKLKPLGELMRIGCDQHKLPPPPPKIEQALLIAGFKLAVQDVPFTTTVA